jgi:putative aldouronate transport system substrate-binding protein
LIYVPFIFEKSPFFSRIVDAHGDSNYNQDMKEKIKKRKGAAGIIIAAVVAAVAVSAVTIRFYTGKTGKDTVRKYTGFFNSTGNQLDTDNRVKALIAEKTGAECEESWLEGNFDDAIKACIADEKYPDFISGGQELYEAGALIPIDEYWDAYPNIRNYLTGAEWDTLRMKDGHIYWIPQFGVSGGNRQDTVHNGEAFWMQTRVLKWAGYPKVTTLDEYFDLLERYVKANPTMQDGVTPNIPYTILCDDWKYFCLENPPQFLDGYPNDGCCIVDPKTQKVVDYNTTETARNYFHRLNEEYHKGMVDPESFTETYDDYIAKISTGAVLGMTDQWWDFHYNIVEAYGKQNLSAQGCNYVPLPITMKKGIQNQWHTSIQNEIDVGNGISVTVSCRDVKGALQFINDLLDPEIQTLRFWGIQGTDYSVDEKGRYYLTDAQRSEQSNDHYAASEFCTYSYFPRKEGILPDGINAYEPEYQPDEFYRSLPEDVKECFAAYGCKTYVDMLGDNPAPGPWYPMYSYASLLTDSSQEGRIWKQMAEVKHEWLPRTIMSDHFAETWEEYMKAYADCRPEVFMNAAQREVNSRIKRRDLK